MKRCLPCLLLLLCGPSLAFAQPQTTAAGGSPPATAAFDVPAFATELHRLAGAIGKKPAPEKIAALRQALPEKWTVRAGEQTYSVSTAPLREGLTAGPPASAQKWLENLALEAERYSSSHATPPSARGALTRILNADEFSAVRPPSAWELFRQRVKDWIERLLQKLFSNMARYPMGAEILFWLVLLGGVCAVAFFLLRFVTGRDRIHSLTPYDLFTASRTWQEWIRAAREAAARGDFREAVHSAYWAGIVRLEETGVVPRDRAKTPREYLRMASEISPTGQSPNPRYHKPLSALTSRLEHIWYADRTAGPDDFRDSLQQLEALGCPLE